MDVLLRGGIMYERHQARTGVASSGMRPALRLCAVLAPAAFLLGCTEEKPFLTALAPVAADPAPATLQPAYYPNPDAESYAADGYGDEGGSQYDNGDEIVNGKCLPDHPVNYCTTIDGLFKQPIGTPAYGARQRFLDGNKVFNANWVPAPSARNETRDGLGPTFDAESCARCHDRNGRGRPPAGPTEALDSMIVRVSVAAADGVAGPHALFGEQLNSRAIPGAQAHGRIEIDYEEIAGRFADGEPFTLRKPRHRFMDLQDDTPPETLLASLRIAPPVIGLGLVEAVPDDALLARTDPQDADGDGISGRANYAVDPSDGVRKLGRYGWKAGAVSLRHQTAAALTGDMGITSAYYAGEPAEDPEIAFQDFEDLVFYMQMLAPTPRRDIDDPIASKGETHFADAGCAACHTPRMEAEAHPEVPRLSGYIFHPYSDFLLHDMGEGLADGRSEHDAGPDEWRTPPL